MDDSFATENNTTTTTSTTATCSTSQNDNLAAQESSSSSSSSSQSLPLLSHNWSQPLVTRMATSRPIHILPNEVVDRIAAGEVVQRPAAAIKELLENSLDAGSNEIVVSIEQGGLSKLCVSDNGCGILPDCLELAVKRHATSKLQTAHDLSTIQTFGFRGEALASLSHVARRLTLTSRVAVSSSSSALSSLSSSSSSAVAAAAAVAYQQQFVNGASLGPAKPCARKFGTTVTAEDLFYNLPGRLQSMKARPHDEYNHILYVCQATAIHHARHGVGIVCQKVGGNSNSSNTSKGTAKRHTARGANPTNKVDLNTSTLPAVQALRKEQQQAMMIMMQQPSKQQSQQLPSSHHENQTTNESNEKNHSSDSMQSASSSLASSSSSSLASQATQQAILHVYGSDLRSQLYDFSCAANAETETTRTTTTDPSYMHPTLTRVAKKPKRNSTTHSSSSSSVTTDTSKLPFDDSFTYSCQAVVSSPSYSGKRSTFIFFINHRLVDCPPLQRALHDVYLAIGATGASHTVHKAIQPFVYLSLQVPPEQVDVNVHPTKKIVTLLYLDAICQSIANQLRAFWSAQHHASHTAVDHDRESKSSSRRSGWKEASKNDKVSLSSIPLGSQSDVTVAAIESTSMGSDDKRDSTHKSDNDNDTKQNTGFKWKTSSSLTGQKRPRETSTTPLQQMQLASTQSPPSSQPSANKKVAPSELVRDSSQRGALEKYLIASQPKRTQQQQSLSQSTASTQDASTTVSSSPPLSEENRGQSGYHDPDCPAASSKEIDLSQPGAFAAVVAPCICDADFSGDQNLASQASLAQVVRLPRHVVRHRPLKVMATPCSYTSIQQLRQRIRDQADSELQTKLRSSACSMVGVLSPYRCLIQCGTELVILKYPAFAEQLFYQLALLQFGGGAQLAQFEGIDVQHLIGQAVQLEEILEQQRLHPRRVDSSDELHDIGDHALTVSESNAMLAEQAAQCLVDKSEMLKEYFSIAIEQNQGDKRIYLSGLPVLLEGYTPSPHGLPLFLLRLATEVDWSEEKPCFDGVCRELGSYYAQVSTTNRDSSNEQSLHHIVQHTLFPAICTLLVPSSILSNDGSFCVLTKLSKLYRVFERC